MVSEWVDGPPSRDSWGSFPAGVLLELRGSDTSPASYHVLVGHINERDGVCDDCRSGIRDEDVIRHRVVWTPEP